MPSNHEPVLVHFLQDDMDVEATAGTDLLSIATESQADLTFGCRSGSCGTCRVVVVSGFENLSPPTAEERIFLKKLPNASGQRLACQTKVLGEVSIDLPKR